MGDDALARAALAHCMDGPDPLMYAAHRGAPDAMALVDALADRRASRRDADPDDAASRGAGGDLEGMFLTGAAKWGHRATAQDVGRFRSAVDRWMRRLDSLPSLRADDLRALFTRDGSMWVIAPGHPCWPEQLEDLSVKADWAAPLCLWGQGDPAALTSCEAPIAVVGSRGANDYGRTVARDVAAHAALRGHLIVSGGAYGVDAAAHWGAIAAAERYPSRAGRTVAVFAGGLDHIGPQRNHEMFQRILDASGALVSEMSPDTIPEARRFLLRNRIIAGLARVVVVAQARHRSGALNTASWAADLNREVYAAPGEIMQPSNTGCNMLIHENRAIILVDCEDVTELCHPDHQPREPRTEPEFSPQFNPQSGPQPAPEPADASGARSGRDGHGGHDGRGGRMPQAQAPTQQQPQPALLAADEVPAATPSIKRRLGRGKTPSGAAPDTRPRQAPPEPDDGQRMVLAAIRSCRRRGVHAGEDAIGAALRDALPRNADRTPFNAAWIARQLGSMELAGLAERDGTGAFRPATGTRPSPPASRPPRPAPPNRV
ncbi:DNA-processing protein DprA [Bifidobacterium avesanii]|uniref:DNA-processing protein DprA n=2 Tax=Bifidobacterium avesanii TaxID=1798157 RepID=A0A7K3THA8_9BIFI|nr:DNA-processing protein DprA [Bifidobacterium avesanii]